MKIKIASYAGFCFGVERAMDMAWNKLEENSKVYSLGPLIHNRQAVKKYEDKGLKVIESLEEANDNSKIIIRSHGVPLKVYEESKEKGMEIIDATCPFVKKIQDIANKYYNKGYKIIIIGDSSHPEVIGINGWCNNEAIIVKNIEDLDNIHRNYKKYCVVAQTTMNLKVYEEITKKLNEILDNVEFYNTICSATRERQKAARDLSKEVDAMIVIGGKHSSNTQKLVQICSENTITYHVETIDDLELDKLKKYSFIGITAGASTPKWIIEEVVSSVEKL
ncbi:4-hydroxy-3-methylbut-2-enyl diphosphate reductase [Tepidibacter formicigenes]|uniref:4-hydroxy-3-methylbut-2-enyl diphosphate reductase n=1 Tax=Tepidibacter formicigenes DSM 15518 TaxID=1123349 RepID=A0A1M6MA86_9FIRM|nr:4-hydroxy-3-methylbut-2-enyl diphosphate reductase [Tepidibacter formicigenes]SHJ80386.1 4-hydroxy-3-methylbut-2-enyl diphosphate reductase [Tepidibacter formicigenes DSM 15518]